MKRSAPELLELSRKRARVGTPPQSPRGTKRSNTSSPDEPPSKIARLASDLAKGLKAVPSAGPSDLVENKTPDTLTNNILDSFNGHARISTLHAYYETYHDCLRDLCVQSSIALDELSDSILLPKWKQSDIALTIFKSSNTQDASWESILSEDTHSLSGDTIMRRMNFILDNIPTLTRHEYQIQFHSEINEALIPKIYEKEWAAHSTTILRRYGIRKYQPERLICTPRRFGKTTAVIMYIIAALYCIPNITIAIFSTGKRTAGKLKSGVMKYLRTMPKFEDLIFENNAEQISYRFNAYDTRTISCYPGTVAVCFVSLVGRHSFVPFHLLKKMRV